MEPWNLEASEPLRLQTSESWFVFLFWSSRLLPSFAQIPRLGNKSKIPSCCFHQSTEYPSSLLSWNLQLFLLLVVTLCHSDVYQKYVPPFSFPWYILCNHADIDCSCRDRCIQRSTAHFLINTLTPFLMKRPTHFLLMSCRLSRFQLFVSMSSISVLKILLLSIFPKTFLNVLSPASSVLNVPFSQF